MSLALVKAQKVAELTTSPTFSEAVAAYMAVKTRLRLTKLDVVDSASRDEGNELLFDIKKVWKALDGIEKEGKAPALEYANAIRDVFKEMKLQMKEAEGRVNDKLVEYKEVQERAFEASQKAAMEREIEAKEAGESLPLAGPPVPESVVETESGKTHMQERVKVKVVDKIKLMKAAMDGRNQIPLDIIQFNEPLLKQLARGKMYRPAQWAMKGLEVWRTKSMVSKGK